MVDLRLGWEYLQHFIMIQPRSWRLVSVYYVFLTICGLAYSVPLHPHGLQTKLKGYIKRQSQDPAPSNYAPIHTTCPSNIELVRSAADGISDAESAWLKQRKPKASEALASWLKKTNPGFQFDTTSLPTLGLTTSGGGYRSLLTGAGVVQAFDGRDGALSTNGLYQAISYHSGVSGGAWLLSSIAGNNYATISNLSQGLWDSHFPASLFTPEGGSSAEALSQVVADLVSKWAAGFDMSLTDPWGRLLGYQLFYGNDGGASECMSSIASMPNFLSHSFPYPILTSVGTNPNAGQCLAALDAPQYEFHPFEFGSWDAGIAAFTPIQWLGTPLDNGSPKSPNHCVRNFDNLGFLVGTSSTLFNELTCLPSPPSSEGNPTVLEQLMSGLKSELHDANLDSVSDIGSANFANPFSGYHASSLVADQDELMLVDGGESLQNNPIWPYVGGSRPMDVLLVNDNSADTTDNFPNGTEILTTYQRAQATGRSRMPYIPDVATFVSQGLNKRAAAFGCDDVGKITIVWLPNTVYNYPSNTSSSQMSYSVAELTGMIGNGAMVATQGNDPAWPTCLGCLMLKKTNSALPSDCDVCFSKYCYKK